MARKQTVAWSQTPAGLDAYRTARSSAQEKCNADGCDRGIEANDIFRQWHVFMLPQRNHRSGHELRCEVVSCERINHCQTGHGPR